MKCIYCDELAYKQSVCKKHKDLEALIMRLQWRGKPVTLNNLKIIFRKIPYPLSFTEKELPKLYAQTKDANNSKSL